MARKNNLRSYASIVAGDMSQPQIISNVTNIQFLDNIGIQLNFSGSPVGTFAIQISADFNRDDLGNVLNAGSWIPLTLSYLSGGSTVTATSIPTSVGSPIALDLNQLSFPWIRVVYTMSSGTGTLDAFVTAKML